MKGKMMEVAKMAPADGGPAFPGKSIYRDSQGICHEAHDTGISKRDWFAGQALPIVYMRFATGADPDPADLAVQAYAIADAMLSKRDDEGDA